MKKEEITLNNIKSDFVKLLSFNINNISEWRMLYILPIILIAIFVGLVLKNIWIGLLIFLPAAYHIIRYAIAIKRHFKQKKAVRNITKRQDICISVEKISHISKEMIYEPYRRIRYSYAMKEVPFVYFRSGSRWRIPDSYTHYKWSEEYHISYSGLQNIAITGDEFFFVTLKSDYNVAYIYPCKNFVLEKDLLNAEGEGLL